MTKSRITFEIEQDRVETIVGLLIREVSNFKVEEVQNGSGGDVLLPFINKRRESTKWLNAPAMTIITAMKKEPDKEFFYKDLAPLLVQHGLKPSGITPVISALWRAGRIQKTRRGYYKAK